MINSFFKNISKFTKEKLMKSEFNSKLMYLKGVKLEEMADIDKNARSPLNGLLLDEKLGKYVPIDFESDSSYNRLETLKNIKILNPIKNYQNNSDSMIDYLKKIIFGNKNQNNYSFLKYFKKFRDGREKPNDNFSFNSDGKFIGFINQEEDIIISNTETNEAYAIKSKEITMEGIATFTWDLIYPNKLYFSSNDTLFECIFDQKDLNLFINKCYTLSKFSKFINCFPSPCGNLLIFLYERGIEVYDIFHNLIFSKLFLAYKLLNGLYDYKSSIFIAYSEKKLFMFNTDSFDFKSYSYFYGNIIKVINNPENNNIYVFTVDKSNIINNELFMYTLSDISVSSDVNLNYSSYQNCDNFYGHHHYVSKPEVFRFLNNANVLDVCISPNDFRIAILYDKLVNQIKKNSLYIYGLTKEKDNSISQFIPLYNFGYINGSQIVSFEFNKMMTNGNTFLVVRFEKDNFIKTEKIKG